MLTKGDVMTILGDDWSREQVAQGNLDRLSVALEPAPADWVQLAQKTLREQKKATPGAPAPRG